MKSTVKKISFSVMLVFVMACTLLFGVWSLHTGRVARAEEAGTSVTLSTDLKNGKVSKGKSFTLITTLKTTRELFRNSTNPLMPLDTDRYWASISLRIGLLNDDKTDWNATASDHITASTLVEEDGVSYKELRFEYEGGIRLDLETTAYENSSVELFNSADASKDSLNRGQCLVLSFASKHTNPNATFTGNEVVIKATITVAEDMPTGVYTFGMIQTGEKASLSDSVTFSKSKADTDSLIVNTDGTTAKGTLSANEVQFEVVDASDDPTLNAVKIGQGTAQNPVPADDDFTSLDWGTDEENPVTPVYTVTGPDLDKIVIRPEANDSGATMKIGFSATEDTNDPSTDVAVDPANGATITLTPPATGTETTIYIHVTAEDGTTKKSYPVTVKIGYVRLSNLAGSCDVGTLAGVTKNGVAYNEKYDEGSSQWVAKDATTPVTVFDSEQKAYHVYILSNAGSIDLTATVAANYGASTSIALAKGADSDALKFTDIPSGETEPAEITSATSGTAFCVTGFPSDPIDASASRTYSATLTVTANDAVTTEVYTVYFQIVSVNTAINDLKAKGTSGVEYTSDASKVTPGTADNNYSDRIDYYFSLNSETDFEDESGTPKGVAAMLVTLADSASNVYLRTTTEAGTSDLQFGSTDKHTVGTHTIVVKAEAGNEQTYIVVFAKPEVLQLVFESDYQFLFRELLREGSNDYLRVAYAERDYEHGKDDADWDRIVLGQILPNTSVNTFLTNIPENLHRYINLYQVSRGTKTLIYRRGAAVDSFVDNMDNGNAFPVATGWYLEFGSDEENPTDIIYLSVLGDVDGNGILNANDASVMNSIIALVDPLFTEEEFLLAGYVAQSGGINAADVSYLNAIIASLSSPEDYFSYKKPAPDPAPAA